MKTKLKAFICLALFSVGFSFAQTKASEDNKFEFDSPEHYLDGYTLNYQYQNGNAIHLEFYDGKAKYEWISGPGKGNGNKDIPYRSRKIGTDMYIVNWHETELKDYLNLIFDFNNMVVHGSVIIGYENKPERPLRTMFKSGIIDHLKR